MKSVKMTIFAHVFIAHRDNTRVPCPLLFTILVYPKVRLFLFLNCHPPYTVCVYAFACKTIHVILIGRMCVCVCVPVHVCQKIVFVVE